MHRSCLRRSNGVRSPAHCSVLHEWHVASTDTAKNSFEPTVMIGVSVGENDGTQVVHVRIKHIYIVENRVAPKSRVVEHRLAAALSLHREQQRITMFRDQLLAFRPVPGGC